MKQKLIKYPFHSSTKTDGFVFLIIEEPGRQNTKATIWKVLNRTAKAAARSFFYVPDGVVINEDPTQHDVNPDVVCASRGWHKIWVMDACTYTFMVNTISAYDAIPRNLEINLRAIEADKQL